MSKKILSLVLVFSLLLSVASVVGANAEEAVAKYEPVEGAYELVSALGIMECEEAEYNSTITRGELAKIVSSLVGMAGAQGASAFSDVPLDHPYAPYINALYNASVVSGSSTGVFNPDREVSVNEAITMVVRAMGYTARAEASGGYPTGYLLTARQLELLNLVKLSSSPITKGEMIQLAFNALEANALVFEGVKNDEPMYGTYDDVSLGDYVFGVKHITGVVEAVDLSALQGENELGARTIEVNGTRIFSLMDSLWGYLGYEADVWYKETRKGTNELVYIRKSDYNRVTEISLEDIINIERGVVEYYDEKGDKKSVTYRIAGPVIYNTVATYESFDMDMLSSMDGGVVRLISNDGNKEADVVVVEAYKDYVVSAINSREMKLYDKFDKENQMVLDTTIDDPYTIIYDIEGTEIYLNNISVGDVLSIYASKLDADQKFIKAIRHSEIIEGEITEITHFNGSAEIKIGEENYKLTKRCYTNCKKDIVLGMFVSATLNFEGAISHITQMKQDLEFIYLLGMGSTTGLDSKLMIKFMRMNGTFDVLNLSDRLYIDKNLYQGGKNGETSVLDTLKKASKTIYPIPVDEDCVTQPVQINVDSKGEVFLIDTVLTKNGVKATKRDVDGTDALFKIGSVRGTHSAIDGRFALSKNFANRFLAGSDCKVILVPSPETADGAAMNYVETAYAFTNADYFGGTGNVYFYADAYTTKANSVSADYIISPKSGAMISGDTEVVMVKKVRKALLPDETIGYKITVVTASGDKEINMREETTYTVDSVVRKADFLNEGDVIKYSINAAGYVEEGGINLHFSPVNKKVYISETPADGILKSGYANILGYVHEVTDDAFTFAMGVSDVDKMAAIDESTLNLSTKSGYVVGLDFSEPEGKRIYSSSADELLGYRDVGKDCSFIYLNSVDSRIRFMVVINGYDLVE